MGGCGVGGRASIVIALCASLAPAAHAQDDAPRLVIPRASPIWIVGDDDPARTPSVFPPLDVDERFASFQRDFEREFGRPRGRGGRGVPTTEEAFALRMKERLEERFQDSPLLDWYKGAERIYERAEGFYQRIERSTRWAGQGFEVHTQMESVVDGRMRVEVAREVRGFRVAFDVRDASEGRFGLRTGGTVRGYRISVDVSDLAAGTLRLQLDKRFD